MEYLSNKNLKLAAVILLFFILLFANTANVDFYFFNWLENGIYNLISPFLNVVENVISSINNYYVAFLKTGEIVDENERLREEVARLSTDNAMLEEAREQNERFRDLLSFRATVPGEPDIISAGVVGYSPATWQRMLTVNAGRNDGVKVSMPVIGYQGNLKGRVEKAGMNSSQVKLISDPEFQVGGRVARSDSRALGLVRGLPESDEEVIMENIRWDADIEKGDLIVTSAVSDNYPPGIPIGEVKRVEVGKQGLSQVAEVNLKGFQRTAEEAVIIREW